MDPSTDIDSSAMWLQIQRMPFQQLQETDEFVYIEKVMTLVARYVFLETDPNMAVPKCTVSIAKLLKIVCAKSLLEFGLLRKKQNETNAELANAQRGFNAQLEAKEKEIENLNKVLRDVSKGELSQNAADYLVTVEELSRVKAENDTLTLKVHSLMRQTDELKQVLASRSDDRSYLNDTYDKAQLEYRHLAARYKRLADRSAKTEDMLDEMRREERTKKLDTNDELDRLRQKVQSLQQENYALVQSRDRAEELCEKREEEALRDMTELRRLNRDLLEEERSKNQVLRDEFLNAKQEADAHVEQLLQQHEQELDEQKEEVSILRRQLEKATSKRKGRFNSDNSSSADDSSSRSSRRSGESEEQVQVAAGSRKMRGVSSEEQRKVERENDDLRAEVEQLELRIDALDEENRRLKSLVKNYESGNEGLYRLRQELADQTRTVEILQSENSQLRERLNGMEDSITFNAALRELCKRVGVTENEINSLRPQNATAYSEMDTLKEEVSLMKAEVEWLERERRYWMNKVRLQPLMDTKLRFELGLTSEQLKQLDKLVDQMKSGSIVVEDNDESYKDKYFKELQARRRDAEQFNTYVKQRINEALKDAFVDVSNSSTAAAVSQLRDHIDVITATPTSEANAHAEEKIRTMTQRLEELERAEKTRSEEMARLREQVVAGNTEREVISRERDQYREAIFGAAGMGSGQDDATPSLGDFGESSAGTLSNAKWLKVSNTLREQLRAKDTLIDTLGKEVNELKEKLEAERQCEVQMKEAAEEQKAELAALKDQIKALTMLNEEATEKCNALSGVNKDLEDGLQHLESGAAKEALLKVVLLRRREATLLQRLRRALSAQEETASSEEKLKSQVTSTLEKLRETLEDTSSTGSVLPRSSGGCSMEGEMLNVLDSAVQHMLQGKLFREDSRFLIHLRQVYQGMGTSEELMELRLDAKRLRGEMEEKQKALDELSAEAEGLRAASAAAEDTKANHHSEYAEAARAKAEAEAATYRQKYTLLAKRLEARDKEVTQLESELDDARKEVVDVRDHIRNILSDTADPQSTPGDGQSRAKVDATQVARLEKEVARLKSVNLGLLHHSLDLQSQVKSVEIEVSAKQQEITLLKASADSPVVTSFVTAAIREHAALRRQSELALIQAKRLRMQLAATEANYHVVANEAMSYKLGAYRLYRKYVDQVVATVDYLRCVQRASKGSLSPHQAEIMDRRLGKTISDLGKCFGRNKMLAMQLSDAQNALVTLEQQLSLRRMEEGAAKKDAMDVKLQEARVRLRDLERLMVESKEEQQYLQGKLSRAEAANKDLNAEVARLEFGNLAVSPLDEQLLATLLQLKESVFDKTVVPPLSIETPNFLRRGKTGASGVDDDMAIREYTSAITRQTELAQQCASLKKQLADVSADHRRAEQKIAQLREELQQCGETATLAQRQIEEERQKATLREVRLERAYETQSDVARRATEHNVRCLQEMVQKKEHIIESLQEQLSAERQKFTEHELDEAVRMERLHEHMFRENTAMVERFKNAIETVGDSLRQTSDSAEAPPPHLLLPSSGNGVEEQLTALTAETVRLRQQLKEARTTNIVLESQIENQVHQQLFNAATPAPAAAQTDAQAPREGNTDTLMGIVRNQMAMLESLRQRELHLSEELAREKAQRASAERQLDDAQRQRVEQGGALQLLSQATGAFYGGGVDAPLVSELRAQNDYLEQELRGLRRVLEEERAQARRFQMDAAEWKAHLDALQATVATQQVETERAQHLATLNEGLQTDLNAVKEQNDRLVLAASVLKQKLMEEAHRSGESSRQHQQEIALAQRMGTIQQESAGHMKVLDQRIRAIQKELNDRVEKERSILEKNTESQRLVYQLHQQLRAKEREVMELQDQLRMRGSAPLSPALRKATSRSSSPLTESRGTQMLSTTTPSSLRGKENVMAGSRTTSGTTPAVTAQQPQQQPSAPSASTPRPESDAAPARTTLAPISAHDALLQPQIAGLVQRETQKQQRDNLAEISTLRSRVHRLEKDVEEAEEQLKGEREATRQLRLQLRQIREGQDRKEREYATQLAAMHHKRVNAESQLSRQGAAAGTVKLDASPAPAATAVASRSEHALQEQVASQERTIQRYRQELEELKQTRVTSTQNVEPAYLASPSDIRSHVVEVRRLESVIDGLRRRLSVEGPVRENELQQRLSHANAVVQRMAADLASVRGLPVSEIEAIYCVTTTTTTTSSTSASGITQETTGELRSELLRKSNEVLDLRFKVENLELQLSRAQRHLSEVLAVDGAAATTPAGAKGKGDTTTTTSDVQALHNLIENLKLVIERLQSENAQLHSAEVQSARYVRQSRELHDLQERERRLQSQLQSLTQQLTLAHGSSKVGMTSPSPSAGPGGDLHRRLATAQAAAEQYEAELDELRQRLSANDRHVVRPLDPTQSAATSPRSVGVASASRPTVPPPLPQSRFSHSHRQPGSVVSSTSGPLQRRLSSNRLSRASDSGPDDHGSLRHHHLDQH
ncbi:hypothetical protein ABB37_00190 [Leptomonas pyrrhocoris]|uniref:Uncharacterized protein n=1 Tax=Leptomonas pyrrhocoris TaxID=157538 RepID=A0A0N1J5F7_LEPPY|nr:hypothetical protein ABB37_00190 [Leptomonas pyrrhocoris]KPA85864.1 hypothetical protein ABB37_00190 [Leptomonas pyrrhocoris]|eukprot:XP_015664303.1 hypothetical protein ABB37_00190 [Leptomonas pyrrhocoris]